MSRPGLVVGTSHAAPRQAPGGLDSQVAAAAAVMKSLAESEDPDEDTSAADVDEDPVSQLLRSAPRNRSRSAPLSTGGPPSPPPACSRSLVGRCALTRVASSRDVRGSFVHWDRPGSPLQHLHWDQDPARF